MYRNITHLLFTRRFLPLFSTMFLGALNDNIFRTALITYVTFHATGLAESQRVLMVSVAVGLFMLPYFLFSALAGQLADKYAKEKIIRCVKIAEIFIMAAAAIGFVTGQVLALIALLFLMGTHSAFFGPPKYSILPDHLREGELLGANGLMEAGTFLAILLGTLIGGLLMADSTMGPWLSAVIVLLVAVLGYLASRAIPAAPIAAPHSRVQYNLFTSSWHLLQTTAAHKTQMRAVLLISWFWLIGSAFLAQIPNLTRTVFLLDESGLTLLMMVFSLGVGVGSLSINALLKGKISLKLVPWSALGLTLFIAHFALATPPLPPAGAAALPIAAFVGSAEGLRIVLDLFAVAVAGGIFIVPLYALLQLEADAKTRSRVIATNNILNAFFMVFASLIASALLAKGVPILDFFLLLAVLNGVLTAVLFLRFSRRAL